MHDGRVWTIEEIFEARFDGCLKAVVHSECRPARIAEVGKGGWLFLRRIGGKTYPDVTVLLNARECRHAGIRVTGRLSRNGWYANGGAGTVVAPAVIGAFDCTLTDSPTGEWHAAMGAPVFECGR
jgi:hypothetical protein